MAPTSLVRFAGETIDSEIELPELEPARATDVPSLRVRLGRGTPPPLTSSANGGWRANGGVTFRVDQIATVHINDTLDEIACFAEPEARPSALSHVIVDHALPRRLALADRLVFHATAVALGDCAVAIVAPSGLGKSTLSAALVGKGGRWLADDCLLLTSLDGKLVVEPTFSGTRLWPDSGTALGLSSDAALIIDHRSRKQRWTAADAGASATAATALAAILVLSESPADTDVTTTRLGAGPAVQAVASQWHMAFALPPAEFLQRAAQILSAVPVYCLRVPRSFDRLDEVVEVITNLVHGLSIASSIEGR